MVKALLDFNKRYLGTITALFTGYSPLSMYLKSAYARAIASKSILNFFKSL